MDDFYNALHPYDREDTIKAFHDAIDPAQRRTYDVEYRTIGKEDGCIRWVAAKGRALFDDEGRCIRAMGTVIDITARKETDAHIRAQNEALKNARENLTTIFNASSEGLALCKAIRNASGDLVDYQVLDVNPAHENLTGASRSQMLSKVVSQIAPPVKPIWFESADRALKTGALQTFELRSPVTGRWLDIHVSPVSGDYFAQTFIDVTERHELEQQRVEFIAEMNHRVKNNFQMVASVLNLQARRSHNLEVKDQLKTAQHRIHVLAELHDSLSAAPQVGQVDFSAYLKALCEKLRSSINDADRIELRFSAEPATFDSSVAVPLGFVINELVTNAIKYAFPAPASGVINVVFAAHGDGYVLKVSDNGQGLSQAKPANSGGLGMRLVKSFVKQIGGEVEVAQKLGLLYSIKIPPRPDGLSAVSTR
jgi:PAS domain S-box-containing protein